MYKIIRKKDYNFIVGILVLLLIIIGFYIYKYQIIKNDQKNTPVIIYTEQINEINTPDRLWIVDKIFRKIGDNQSEELATVGKVGEFPANFALSPNKKFLLINLESKLQILNLDTKEIKDIFIPKKAVYSVVFSPDSRKIFIWDQKYVSQDQDYFVHIFDIDTKNDQIIKKGTGDIFFGTVWRNDNIILINSPKGEFSIPFYFDLNKNEIEKTPGDFITGINSQNGNLEAVPSNSVDDICNDFSGSATSGYNIIDPISGRIVSKVGGNQDQVDIVTFSPDDKEIIYAVKKSWTDKKDCNKEPESSFFRANIKTGESVKLDDVSKILKQWNSDYINATVNYQNSLWSIIFNGKDMDKYDKQLEVIAQFYQ